MSIAISQGPAVSGESAASSFTTLVGEEFAPVASAAAPTGAMVRGVPQAASTLAWKGFALRGSLALVFVWFGMLKVCGASPAEDLVSKTVTILPADFFVPFLGIVETAIGLGLLWRRTLPLAFACFLVQMAGTLLPLLVLPEVCFDRFPWALSLEGQYIVKNVVLISAAFAAVSSNAAPKQAD